MIKVKILLNLNQHSREEEKVYLSSNLIYNKAKNKRLKTEGNEKYDAEPKSFQF
jgi:hypothetical protein